jgi:hypothetical protein
VEGSGRQISKKRVTDSIEVKGKEGAQHTLQGKAHKKADYSVTGLVFLPQLYWYKIN